MQEKYDRYNRGVRYLLGRLRYTSIASHRLLTNRACDMAAFDSERCCWPAEWNYALVNNTVGYRV